MSRIMCWTCYVPFGADIAEWLSLKITNDGLCLVYNDDPEISLLQAPVHFATGKGSLVTGLKDTLRYLLVHHLILVLCRGRSEGGLPDFPYSRYGKYQKHVIDGVIAKQAKIAAFIIYKRFVQEYDLEGHITRVRRFAPKVQAWMVGYALGPRRPVCLDLVKSFKERLDLVMDYPGLLFLKESERSPKTVSRTRGIPLGMLKRYYMCGDRYLANGAASTIGRLWPSVSNFLPQGPRRLSYFWDCIIEGARCTGTSTIERPRQNSALLEASIRNYQHWDKEAAKTCRRMSKRHKAAIMSRIGELGDAIWDGPEYQMPAFNPRWSHARINRYIEEYHRLTAVNRRSYTQATQAPPEVQECLAKLPAEVNNDKYRIKELATWEDLSEEGKRMHHCVGGYFDRVESKHCKIYHLGIHSVVHPSGRTRTSSSKDKIFYDAKTSVTVQVGTRKFIKNPFDEEENIQVLYVVQAHGLMNRVPVEVEYKVIKELLGIGGGV